MTYTFFEWTDLQVIAKIGSFCPIDGDAEFHVMIEINDTFINAEAQYRSLEEAVQRLIKQPDLKKATLIWKRFFVSDAINQAPYLTSSTGEAVSIVQQPPLNGAKASLWLYFVENAQLSADTGGTWLMKRPKYEHLFYTQLCYRTGNVEEQTCKIFEHFDESLARRNCTLKNNCIRTWVFVQDVDVQYAGMVTARKNLFEKNGLTEKTHYIASTGIEGRYIYPEVLMLMDTYALTNIQPGQVSYLQAPTHLNPTYEYGVTFERGTTIDYGDRRHIFISGTASINHRGEIVYPLDVEKQTERTLENIQALLAEANATMQDVAHMIVYLRDTADYMIVNHYIKKRYAHVPRVMVLAPVCRPGWLVEIECMAMKHTKNEQFATF